MAGPVRGTPRLHINRSLITIIILFVLAGCIMIVLTNMAINMMSASRSYTTMQAVWAQSQHAAVNHLSRYAHEGRNHDYREYRNSMETVNGIRMALNELHSKKPNPKVIYKGFEETKLHPADITSMITAFNRFGYVTNLDRFYRKWNSVYDKAVKLDSLGKVIKKAREKNPPNIAQVNRTMKKLRMLSDEMMSKKQDLLLEMATLARTIRQLALWLIVFVGIILVITGVLVSVRVTKSVQKWRDVLQERDYLASFPENNPTPIVHVDPAGEVIYQNPASLELFPTLAERGREHPFLENLSTIHERMSQEDNVLTREVEVDEAIYQQTIFCLQQMEALYIYAVDITHQKESEKKVRKSLKEKEVLLGEIHHRVKNNLAVISGLLEMQMMQIENEQAQNALKDSRARIHTMASIHEILYDSEQFSEINLKDYVKELQEYVKEAYGTGEKNITINTEVEEVKLNINQAIPCGLILNELIANAIEHGCNDEKRGRICINLKERNNKVEMTVKDNGKGLPEDFDFNAETSMGMTIVDTLLTQLDADLNINDEQGTKFHIIFEKSDAPGSRSRML